MSAELKIREALAAGPTPGPWSLHARSSMSVAGPGSTVVAACGGHADNSRNPDELQAELQANALLITACNPAAIAELLAELDRLRATPAPGAPAGFKLVPIRPTMGQLKAGGTAVLKTYCSRAGARPDRDNLSTADVAYRAMLDAAPGAPGQEAAFPPRILALLREVADRNGTATHGPFEDGNGAMVRMTCRRCDYESDWLYLPTVTEAKRGIPCPKCNSGLQGEEAP